MVEAVSGDTQSSEIRRLGMSASAERCRRPKAGSGIKKLLEKEDVDSFYSNAYGGFVDTADDGEFLISDESSASSEEIDSENEKEHSDEENDFFEDTDHKEKTKRTTRLSSKKSKEVKSTVPKISKKIPVKSSSKNAESKNVQKTKPKPQKEPTDPSENPRTLRQSTKRNVDKDDLFILKKRAPQKKSRIKILSQQEMLEEAKITEIMNTESLKTFVRLEISKKPTMRGRRKKELNEPFVRYASFCVPTELPQEAGGQINSKRDSMVQREMITRNLVTFHNVSLPFKEMNEKQSLPSTTRKKICAVSGKVAKYIDPISETPFADVDSFRTLRKRNRDSLKVLSSR